MILIMILILFAFWKDQEHDQDHEQENHRSIAFPATLISNHFMPKLTIRSESGESTSHDLVEETYTIGRSPENSIRLEDVSVSGRHAELALIGENCYLKDLGSTNGTLVNGQPVTDGQLRAGDRVRFGKVEACFECEVASGAQPLPRLEEVEARPAELSARPADFANASPFPSRKKIKDSARSAVLAAAAVAFLAFLGSMIALFLMQPPAL
jgi:predicted component of type VI protein secretion system